MIEAADITGVPAILEGKELLVGRLVGQRVVELVLLVAHGQARGEFPHAAGGLRQLGFVRTTEYVRVRAETTLDEELELPCFCRCC